MHLKFGNELTLEEQQIVLSQYVHRFTRDHRPAWSTKLRASNNKPYPVQFASDLEWLANTEFAINSNGSLKRTAQQCFSHPTWPDNPELLKISLLCRK
jgi:hypothetical protein